MATTKRKTPLTADAGSAPALLSGATAAPRSARRAAAVPAKESLEESERQGAGQAPKKVVKKALKKVVKKAPKKVVKMNARSATKKAAKKQAQSTLDRAKNAPIAAEQPRKQRLAATKAHLAHGASVGRRRQAKRDSR